MSCYSNTCCMTNGLSDSDSLENPWKDPAMWWMLGGIVLASVLSSLVSIPANLSKWDKRVDTAIDKEFWIPLPEWTIPLLWVGIYITYFFGSYLTLRRIKSDCEKSQSDKDKDTGLLWLIYVIVLALMVLWSFSYLGAKQPHLAILFTLGLIAAVIWQLVLSSRYGVTGAWYLVLPLLVYVSLIALPLTVSSAWATGKPEYSHHNKSMVHHKLGKFGEAPSTLFSSLKNLAP